MFLKVNIKLWGFNYLFIHNNRFKITLDILQSAIFKVDNL